MKDSAEPKDQKIRESQDKHLGIEAKRIHRSTRPGRKSQFETTKRYTKNSFRSLPEQEAVGSGICGKNPGTAGITGVEELEAVVG